MKRPTVLHCVREWGVPSQRFVVDLVTTTTATRAMVACGEDGGGHRAPVRVPVHLVPPRLGRRGEIAAIAALAATRRADLLHCHLGYWAGAVGRAAAAVRRPWVVSLHGHDFLVRVKEHGPRALEPLRRADLVIVPSSFLAAEVERQGIDPDRIRVIPSGVDLARFAFRERAPGPDGRVVVTFVGRFAEKKGALDATTAVSEVARRHPKVVARFVGYGPQEAELRAALTGAPFAAEIVDGRTPGAVEQALAETHLVVTPSRTGSDGDAETLSVVNLEAQASGVPIVTSRHGGIPEGVADDSAVLTAEGDLAALTAALDDLVAHPERWPAMGRAGRRHVALNFELGARTAEVEAAYGALLDRRPFAEARARRSEWPIVSVVVPTYNRRDLVSRTMDALEQQTYPADRVEVVVADDASTDGTIDALEQRSTRWPLRVVTHEVNRSAAEARNSGLAVATGEIIAFTDSDCRPVPTWLEALVAGMDDGVDVVQGRTGPDPDQPLEPLSRTQWVPAEYGLYETCNLAYRRSALDAVGARPFHSDLARDVLAVLGDRLGRLGFGEDTELAWRVKRAGAVSRFAPLAVVHHEVFEPDPGYLVRRAALSACFPLLARRVPELRNAFLWHGLFVGPHRLRVLLALGGAAAAPKRPAAVLLTMPYLMATIRPGRKAWKRRLKAMPVLASRDAVETAALLYGSVKARTVVL